MTLSALNDVQAPLYEESELTEKQNHWYSLFNGRTDFHALLMEYDDTADEVTSSEKAMRATMHLDLEEEQ